MHMTGKKIAHKAQSFLDVVYLSLIHIFSMGHMMWGWPLPSWFEGNHVAMGLVQMILAGIIMVINLSLIHICGSDGGQLSGNVAGDQRS